MIGHLLKLLICEGPERNIWERKSKFGMLNFSRLLNIQIKMSAKDGAILKMCKVTRTALPPLRFVDFVGLVSAGVILFINLLFLVSFPPWDYVSEEGAVSIADS